jgi:uncharacterized spore protein YtfJ
VHPDSELDETCHRDERRRVPYPRRGDDVPGVTSPSTEEPHKEHHTVTSTITPQTADGFTLHTTQLVLEDLSRAAQPDRVFGQPIERGGMTVIPCCELTFGVGTGSGFGQSVSSEKTPAATGQGSGGGGGVHSRPVATIVIRQGKVEVMPIVDVTKVSLAALTTAGFMAWWILRLTAASARERRDRALPTNLMAGVPSLRKLLGALTLHGG